MLARAFVGLNDVAARARLDPVVTPALVSGCTRLLAAPSVCLVNIMVLSVVNIVVVAPFVGKREITEVLSTLVTPVTKFVVAPFVPLGADPVKPLVDASVAVDSFTALVIADNVTDTDESVLVF